MASRGLTVAVTTLVLSMMLGASPAVAEQLKAKDDPKTSDNMTLGGRKCSRARDKHDGKTIAIIHSCQRFYLLDATSEDDADRDYGVFWLQSTIDPSPGWCATSVSSDIVFGADAAKVVSTVPVDTLNTEKPARLKTVLQVDADDHASQEGRISQISRLYPDGIDGDLSRDGDKRRFRLTWSGSNDHQLALVSGVQVSWNTTDGPPKTTRFGLRKYTLVEKDSC